MKKRAVSLMAFAALGAAFMLAMTGCLNPTGPGANDSPGVAADKTALTITFAGADTAAVDCESRLTKAPRGEKVNGCQ